ncbi:hypothetical protein ACOSP7_007794 [Xanthoceras sorbifolium]
MAKQSPAYFVVFALTCFLGSGMISAETRAVSIDEIDLAGQLSGKGGIEADNTTSSFVETERKWCIAKPSTHDEQLNKNVDFACNEMQHPIYNCTMIEQGGPCYNPTNKVSNASVVMHLYYQLFGKEPHQCDFSGSGITIYDDPSVGTCIYPLF